MSIFLSFLTLISIFFLEMKDKQVGSVTKKAKIKDRRRRKNTFLITENLISTGKKRNKKYIRLHWRGVKLSYFSCLLQTLVGRDYFRTSPPITLRLKEIVPFPPFNLRKGKENVRRAKEKAEEPLKWGNTHTHTHSGGEKQRKLKRVRERKIRNGNEKAVDG